MTAEELFELPEDGYRYELVDGDLVRMTPAGAEHGVVTARVGYVLQEYAEEHGGVCCGAETGFILRRMPDIVRAPDAAFVSDERVPESGIPKSFWPFAPDLAVEVPSPNDRSPKCTSRSPSTSRRGHAWSGSSSPRPGAYTCIDLRTTCRWSSRMAS